MAEGGKKEVKNDMMQDWYDGWNQEAEALHFVFSEWNL